MRLFKKLAAAVLSLSMAMSVAAPAMPVAAAEAKTATINFVQNTETPNTLGFFDQTTDQFTAYSDIKTDGISSQIYKPVSGDVMVVTFHGNGEGGYEGNCNNYAQISANELAKAFVDPAVQQKFKGAYVLSFQAPHDWYHDMSEEAAKIINKAKAEFGINQIFVSGLSAGGLMSQRMIAKYPDMFDGALYSCAAISKNDTYIEGLGGDYKDSKEYINEALKLKKPVDYDTYVANYDKWLESIAASKTALFMVHAKNDPTISSTWTQYAYDKITALRKEAGSTVPVYYNIIDTVNYGNSSYGEHFSWVKMLNNDILDSTGKVRTINFLTGLSKSKNTYTAKNYTIPTAGAAEEANTYKFNLISEVKDGGQVITKAVIDMNGDKVDARKLSTETFKVKAYGIDASGLLDANAEPQKSDVAVKDVIVNKDGNIEITFATERAILSYTMPYTRNLTAYERYEIAPAELSIVSKTYFVQNEESPNGLGYFDAEADQFIPYSDVKTDGISSQIYKPVSGDVMVVTFHGNGEGGALDKENNYVCNNYAQLAGNELAVAYTAPGMQAKLKGAYVLAFQAPYDWYHDMSEVAAKIINKAKEEFGIKQIFVSGLSAGGLMSQRMIAKYPDMFDGALYSCAAISKNDTYVEGLGGDYDYKGGATQYIDSALRLKKPVDYDTYVANYDKWLESIAGSKTAIFMVHAEKDTTISSTWTKYAYEKLTALRKAAGNTAPVYCKILDTVNYGNSSYGEHFSWVKMLNNDVIDSTGTIKTMDFIASLVTSENEYQPKAHTVPVAGPAAEESTYKFNVISEVKDNGQQIVGAVIDMNGDKVNADELDVNTFKITRYTVDASGLLTPPATVRTYNVNVGDVYVNADGNIVIKFAADTATLTYSNSRNLTAHVHYSIQPVGLNIEKKAAAPVAPVVKKPAKVVIKKATPSKKKIIVSWKKVSGATKYQVAYKKACAKTWKYTTTTKLTKTISKLASRVKYSVKVRAYNGKYGAWSAVKTVKVK